ncbi:MAG: hypothetical protein FWE59_00480 [Oscillospiraceae bacterium]|nr:hypothetical protein [Oscillospiraceae bacterium]
MKLRQFLHWFQNTFWYHYKWHTIGVLGGIALVAFSVASVLGREIPDFKYILVADGFAGDTYIEWTDLATERLADLNGDGQVIVHGMALGFSNSEMGMASRIKFQAELTNDELLVLVLDEATLTDLGYMVESGDFLMPLSDLGLPSLPDSPWLMRVDPPPSLESLGAVRDFYLCVRALTPEKRADPEIWVHYEQAIAFANMLWEMNQP